MSKAKSTSRKSKSANTSRTFSSVVVAYAERKGMSNVTKAGKALRSRIRAKDADIRGDKQLAPWIEGKERADRSPYKGMTDAQMTRLFDIIS